MSQIITGRYDFNDCKLKRCNRVCVFNVCRRGIYSYMYCNMTALYRKSMLYLLFDSCALKLCFIIMQSLSMFVLYLNLCCQFSVYSIQYSTYISNKYISTHKSIASRYLHREKKFLLSSQNRFDISRKKSKSDSLTSHFLN